MPFAAPLIATEAMSVVPCWLIEIDGAVAKALDDVAVMVIVPALNVGTAAGVVLVMLVTVMTLCEMLTTHARAAPETMVVPGTMPHDGVAGAQEITWPTAIAPLLRAVIASAVPLIVPVNVAAVYVMTKVGATVSITMPLLLSAWSLVRSGSVNGVASLPD